MKKCKFLLLLLCVGCSSTQVIYDYDTTTNFNKYTTFSFFEDVGAGLNNLDVNRLLEVVESELNNLGFKKSKNADFYINFSVEKQAINNGNRVSLGIGSGGRNVGFGISGGIPIGVKKINEILTIDFVDAKTDQLIWQGVATSKINEKTTPQQRVIYFKEVIKKILSKYPPEKKIL